MAATRIEPRMHSHCRVMPSHWPAVGAEKARRETRGKRKTGGRSSRAPRVVQDEHGSARARGHQRHDLRNGVSIPTEGRRVIDLNANRARFDLFVTTAFHPTDVR
jgi:hypothetical protein